MPTETCTPELANDSVALLVVGYHYDGNWVIPSVELSSTRTSASFAAQGILQRQIGFRWNTLVMCGLGAAP